MLNRLSVTLLTAVGLAVGGTRDLGAQEVIYYRARQLKECGRLGIAFIPADEGILIADLLPGAPGERAGLKAGDEVMRINGTPATMGVLDTVSRALKPGERVRFQLRRGGRAQEVGVVAAAGTCTRQVIATEQMQALQEALQTLQGGTIRLDTLRINLIEGTGVRAEMLSALDSLVQRHQAVAIRARGEVLESNRHLLPIEALDIGARTVAGAEFSELNDDLAQYFRGAGEGLLVLRVAPETPGARAGLRPGDVVVRAGGNAVRTIRDLRLNIARAGHQTVTIDIVRQGRKHELRLPTER